MKNDTETNINKESFKGLFEERKIFGRTLIKFIESIKPKNIDDPEHPEETEDTRVISIDADWGFGKTKFMNALKTELENKNFIVFTFNAWSNDFENDPLIPLGQEIISQLSSTKKITSKIKETLIDTKYNIYAVGNEIGRVLSKINFSYSDGQNTLSAQLSEVDYIDSRKRISKTVEKLKEKNEPTFLNESETHKIISYYKEQLIEIYNKANIDKSKKIIVLVDELDRCRPTFAIELLERVKHFFDTGKYLFIFTINSKQLSSSVKQIYGDGFEETGYFRRFFDYEFTLPVPKISNIEDFFLHSSIYDKFTGTYKETIKYFQSCFISQDISLRTCEKINNFIRLILTMESDTTLFEENNILYLAFGIFIKFITPELFSDIFIKRTIPKEISKQAINKIEKSFSFTSFNTNESPEDESKINFEIWLPYFINLHKKNNLKVFGQEDSLVLSLSCVNFSSDFYTQKHSSFYMINQMPRIIENQYWCFIEFINDINELNNIIIFGANQIDTSSRNE